MECFIDWRDPGPAAWEATYETMPRSTLLQSRAYADALCPGLGQRPLRATIHIDGVTAGLVQLQEAALLRRAVHAVSLDRGPVWVAGMGTAPQIQAFFTTLCAHFPTRFARKRRFLPEAPASARSRLNAIRDLSATAASTPYQTIWCDLSAPDADLRKKLKPKWRNMLSKAERQETTVNWDWHGHLLTPFLLGYCAQREDIGTPGTAPDTLKCLAKYFIPGKNMLIGLASAADNTPLAGFLAFRHGRSATYQAGWITGAGRAAAANHLLLWQAMLELRAADVLELDLGGVNDSGAAGVKRFKEGLGGQLVELAGHYR
ncbi:MAG: GNAT family N-acetyltransferase [Pseudomonadota bacterium]